MQSSNTGPRRSDRALAKAKQAQGSIRSQSQTSTLTKLVVVPKKAVGFGSMTRRDLGETPIDQITSFAYIPDVRRLHALDNAQMREVRQVQQRAQPIRRVASISSLASGSGTAQQIMTTRTIHHSVSSRPNAIEIDAPLASSTKTITSRQQSKSQLQSQFARSKSIQPAQKMIRDLVKQKHAKMLENLFKENDELMFGERVETNYALLEEPYPQLLAIPLLTEENKEDFIDPDSKGYAAHLGLNAQQNNKQPGQMGGSTTPRSLNQIESPSGELLTRMQQMPLGLIPLQQAQQEAKIGVNKVIIEAETPAFPLHSNQNDSSEVESVYQQPHDLNSDRLLKKSSSVQQSSVDYIDSQQKPRHKRKKGGSKAMQQTLNDAVIQSNPSFGAVSPPRMTGIVVTRKLAPNDDMVLNRQPSNLQRYRQEAQVQHKAIVDQLTSEFMEALHGHQQQAQPQNTSSDTISANELEFPSIGVKSTLQSLPGLDQLSSLQQSNSSKFLLQTKQRLEHQNETSKNHHSELTSVLMSQNRVIPEESGSGPWDVYSSVKQTAPDQFVHSIPLLGTKSEHELQASKIPRKLLQQELSGERTYLNISDRKPNRFQRIASQMQGNVKLELPERVDEIIPRLSKFPLQGKEIEAAIDAADDSTFSTIKKKRRKRENISASVGILGEQNLSSKAALNLKLLKKSRKSIDQAIPGRIIKNSLGLASGNQGVRGTQLNKDKSQTELKMKAQGTKFITDEFRLQSRGASTVQKRLSIAPSNDQFDPDSVKKMWFDLECEAADFQKQSELAAEGGTINIPLVTQTRLLSTGQGTPASMHAKNLSPSSKLNSSEKKRIGDVRVSTTKLREGKTDMNSAETTFLDLNNSEDGSQSRDSLNQQMPSMAQSREEATQQQQQSEEGDEKYEQDSAGAKNGNLTKILATSRINKPVKENSRILQAQQFKSNQTTNGGNKSLKQSNSNQDIGYVLDNETNPINYGNVMIVGDGSEKVRGGPNKVKKKKKMVNTTTTGIDEIGDFINQRSLKGAKVANVIQTQVCSNKESFQKPLVLPELNHQQLLIQMQKQNSRQGSPWKGSNTMDSQMLLQQQTVNELYSTQHEELNKGSLNQDMILDEEGVQHLYTNKNGSSEIIGKVFRIQPLIEYGSLPEPQTAGNETPDGDLTKINYGQCDNQKVNDNTPVRCMGAVKYAMQQVKDLKRQREGKKKSRYMSNGGMAISREQRFKYTEKEQKQQQMMPGPGSYITISPREKSLNNIVVGISSRRDIGRPSPPKSTGIVKISVQKNIRTLQTQESVKTIAQMSSSPSRDHLPENLSLLQEVVVGAQIKKVAPASKQAPSANFKSKVPRDFQKLQKPNQNNIGDYKDQERGTIMADQQNLALKMIPKMFANRQEQHTINAHKLVRINRLQQLNIVNPAIVKELPGIQESLDENRATIISVANNDKQQRELIDTQSTIEKDQYVIMDEGSSVEESSANFAHYNNNELKSAGGFTSNSAAQHLSGRIDISGYENGFIHIGDQQQSTSERKAVSLLVKELHKKENVDQRQESRLPASLLQPVLLRSEVDVASNYMVSGAIFAPTPINKDEHTDKGGSTLQGNKSLNIESHNISRAISLKSLNEDLGSVCQCVTIHESVSPHQQLLLETKPKILQTIASDYPPSTNILAKREQSAPHQTQKNFN